MKVECWLALVFSIHHLSEFQNITLLLSWAKLSSVKCPESASTNNKSVFGNMGEAEDFGKYQNVTFHNFKWISYMLGVNGYTVYVFD